MEIKIEKNIPMPPTRTSMWKELFSKVTAGDSFVLDNKHNTVIYSIAKDYGYKIAVRKLDASKTRVWIKEKI